MSVLIKHMAMPKGCIYANDKDQTDYCPMLNHDDVPFCQYIENEPESAIGIDERPVYCPLSDVPDTNVGDMISRQAAIDALFELYEYQRDTDPTEAADLVRQGIYLAEKKIEQLPPTEPKLIRCRDCYWWTKQEASLQGRCALTGTYPTGAFFCGNARQRPYPCDPEKNQDCSKTGCYINGGECRHTLNREYRREEE